jgi:hypothetical protein
MLSGPDELQKYVEKRVVTCLTDVTDFVVCRNRRARAAGEHLTLRAISQTFANLPPWPDATRYDVMVTGECCHRSKSIGADLSLITQTMQWLYKEGIHS